MWCLEHIILWFNSLCKQSVAFQRSPYFHETRKTCRAFVSVVLKNYFHVRLAEFGGHLSSILFKIARIEQINTCQRRHARPGKKMEDDATSTAFTAEQFLHAIELNRHRFCKKLTDIIKKVISSCFV